MKKNGVKWYLLCFLGIHIWDKWKLVDSKDCSIKQEHQCIKCGFYKQRVVGQNHNWGTWSSSNPTNITWHWIKRVCYKCGYQQEVDLVKAEQSKKER